MLEIKNLVQINLSFLDLVSLFLHTSDWAMCAVSRVNSSTHSPTFHIIFAPPYGRQAVSRLVAIATSIRSKSTDKKPSASSCP